MQLSTVLSVPVIAVVLNQLAEAAGMVPEAVRVIVVLVCVIVGVAFAMAGLERLHIDNERRRRVGRRCSHLVDAVTARQDRSLFR